MLFALFFTEFGKLSQVVCQISCNSTIFSGDHMNTFLQAIAEGASRIGGTSTHFTRKNYEFSGWRMRCPVGWYVW